MWAKDIMTKGVITVTPLTPVKQLARILNENQISGAPVIDKRGKVIGLVSERDLITGKGTQVRSIMSKKVIGVMEETSVEEIASLMITRNVKRVPVMCGNQIAGIVSRADIVRAIAMGQQVGLRTPVYDL